MGTDTGILVNPETVETYHDRMEAAEKECERFVCIKVDTIAPTTTALTTTHSD
jgi:hypothetical protein